MTRRGFYLALAALVACPAAGHTPYGQWKVLRERFLLVHSTRTDPASDAIAEKIVAILQRVLPRANAMVSRAPDVQRLASLMTTGQAVLAVMRPALARDLFMRRGQFSDYDGSHLRLVLAIDDHVLAAVESFPRHHAWLITAALSENPDGLAVRVAQARTDEGEVPLHAGAAAFAHGEPLEPAR